MSESRRVRLTYSVVCTDELCRKVSEGRRVRLIYLVSRICEQLLRKYRKDGYPSDLCKAERSETFDLLDAVGQAL